MTSRKGVLQRTSYQTMGVDQENLRSQPFMEMVEQPKQRGYRFRYECEGGSHGNIYGITTTRSKKTYPTVKINNYSGAAKVIVTLVTEENPPRPHTHELIGKDCKNGVCTIELKPGNNVATFSGLAIKHSTRKRALEILKQRTTENLKSEKMREIIASGGQVKVDPDSITIPDEEMEEATREATDRSRNINLSVVRLCFQATLRNVDGMFCQTLNGVLSDPIYDAKSPGAAALKICRMDKSSGCCTGDEEVFLLCDKVQKEDIAVCFQEVDESGLVKWEEYGSFGPQDVHRQFAIVFRTPAYRSTDIKSPVPVYVKLKRLTKDEESNQVQFTYYPEQEDKERISVKKRKTLPNFGTGNSGSFPGGGRGGLGLPSSGDPNTGGGGFPGASNRAPSSQPGHMRFSGQQPIVINAEPVLEAFPVKLPFPNIQHSPQMAGLAQMVQQTSTEQYVTQINSPPSAQQIRSPPQQQMIRSPQQQLLQHQQQQQIRSPQQQMNRSPQQQQMIRSPQQHQMLQQQQVPSPTQQLLQQMHSPQQQQQFLHNVPSPQQQQQFLQQQVASPQQQANILQQQFTTLSQDLFNFPDTGTVAEPARFISRGIGSPMAGSVPSQTQDEPTDLSMKGKADPKLHMDCAAPAAMDDIGYGSSEGSLLIGSVLKEPVPSPLAGKSTKHAKKVETREVKKDTADMTQQMKASESALSRLVLSMGERFVSALQDYARTGDVSYLLLVQRHLVVQQDDDGDNILHLAVLYKKLPVLRDLLKVTQTLKVTDPATSPINARNALSQTPLHLAVLLRDAQLTELLVSHNASLWAPDRDGNTAVHLAARMALPRCLEYLLEGARRRGQQRSGVNRLNYDGLSPLHLAVLSGHQECVRLLVSRGGADVNAQEARAGKTALHLATESNELAILGYLAIQAQAEVDIPTYAGATPLHTAVLLDDVGCVSVLVASGADPDAEMVETVATVTEDGGGWESDDDGGERLSSKERQKHRQEEEEKRKELGEDVSEDKDHARTTEDCTGEEEGLVYITPRSLAHGRGKMERLLAGEECTSPLRAPDATFDLSQHLLTLDPQTFSAVTNTQRALARGVMAGSASLQSPPCAQLSDLHTLDTMARAQLSRLLDPPRPGRDWRELARRLNMSGMVCEVEMVASPTRVLLDGYEALDGTLESLHLALTQIQRPDAAEVIDKVKDMRRKVKVTGGFSHVDHLKSSFGALKIAS